jgi:hypothetical protein
VLPDYAALTGEETEAALVERKNAVIKEEKMAWEKRNEEIPLEKREPFKEPVFIGLVVGNWIRISDVGLRHPIPLAREHPRHGHVQFKEQMIAVSDELYVLSPLGKLFVGKTMDDVDRGLKMSGRQKYRGVPIDPKKERAMKLVSMTRPDGNPLDKHSIKITALAQEVNEEIQKRFIEENDIDKVPWILFPFDNLTGRSPKDQMEIEFPHRNTRHEEFLEEFFSVHWPV